MVPTCPDHGRKVLELALGRLNDRESLEAERTLEHCPSCSGWWKTQLEGKVFSVLRPAVDDTFSAFRPPRRRRFPEWLPLAAAAVLALGIGLVLRPDGRFTSETPAPEDANVLVQELFEGDLDDLNLTVVGGTVSSGSERDARDTKDLEQETIFSGGLESGDLSGWSSRS